MEKAKTPLTKWFRAMFLMGEDKRGCSALYLSRQLKVAYSTAWAISHKIRTAMRKRDTMYVLECTVELDDAFFDGTRKGGKQGRGTDKTVVLVGVSLDAQRKPQFVKMSAVENVQGETLKRFAQDMLMKGHRLTPTMTQSISNGCIL